MVIEKTGKKEDFELPESQKYKLTLGIDREVVRRAKIKDINISYWTETLLRIITFNKEEMTTPHEEVLQTWHIFLSEVRKVLEKYDIPKILIGTTVHYELDTKRKKKYVSSRTHWELDSTGY